MATLLRCLVTAGVLLLPGLALADSWRIEPVNVVDVATGDVAEDQAVLVIDGRIDAIGARGSVSGGDRVVDGMGGYLLPGLAEMHAHVPPASRGEQYVQDVLHLYLANGITTIRGMLGEPAHLVLRAQLASGEVVGPRLVTSGPSFNGNTVDTPQEGAARVIEQFEAGYDFLKIHPGMSRESFIAVATQARQIGIPFAGHVSFQTGLHTALEYHQATIDHLDAYAEAMVPEDHPLHGQAPQWFGLNLADGMDMTRVANLARETADADVWQVPTQSLFETTTGEEPLEDLLARPGMDMLGDELRANWVGAVHNFRGQVPAEQRGHFLDARRALLAAMQEAGVGMLLGSDAPQIMNVPGYSVHQELAYLVGAGLTPLQALQSGTINVARFFDEPDRGQARAGMVADLVLLRGNPLVDIAQSATVIGVAREGRWYDRATLDALLDGVRDRKL